MFVYFSPEQVRHYDFKGPDVFVVLDVEPKERKSWVVWEEGKGPDLIIELLSTNTANYDKEAKKMIYQNRMRAPEYYWLDPFNADDWMGFTLRDGMYQPMTLDKQGRLLSPCLGLALVRWNNTYHNVKATWLRWATPEGELLLTYEEAARQRAEIEAQRADNEAQLRREAEQRTAVAEAELTRLKAQIDRQ